MSFLDRFREYRSSLGWALMATALLSAPVVRAQQEIAPPKIVELSRDHGLALPQEEMTLTVHLNPHNEAAYDQAVEELYTPGSSTCHHWFTAAPSASEVETVEKELEARGFSILSVAGDNSSVRVRGTVSSVESAFNTQIHAYGRAGATFHANATPARLTGAAAGLVSSVSGLSDFAMKPMYKFQTNPKTGNRVL